MFCLFRDHDIEADYCMGFEWKENYEQTTGEGIIQNRHYTFYLRILLFFAWSHTLCHRMLCLQIHVFRQS